MIFYQIRPLRPEAHLFRVTVEVTEPMPEGQAFRMPAWIPGSYMIRDFARHVVQFSAEHEGKPLDWLKIDKDTWQLAAVNGPVNVTLDIYAWDLSVRGAHLDTTHGYFNGTCVFPAVMGHEDEPYEVEILPPESKNLACWKLATGMPRKTGGEWDFGVFTVENYDALIDYPIEMGNFDHASFEAGGITHRVVLSGRHQADSTRLCADLKLICEEHINLFGGPPPMDDYLFMTLVTGDGYGGLEHRNSTSLMCKRNDLPRRTDLPGEVRDGYRNYLGLCSHEYFHSWNIKRIKPAVFTPFDLSREVHTELLWAFEGITSYYDDLALVRSERISVDSYLEMLAQTITRVRRGSGRLKQTVTESSFDAWTRFYKQDENAPNAIVSYYAKGALVALALDLTLRQRSAGKVSLDDLMRQLWKDYGQPGQGVPEQGIQPLAEALLGESMDDFFRLALYSTEDLPLEVLLAEQGVQLNWRPPAGHGDQGGKPARKATPWLGARLAEDVRGVRLAMVHDDGPAMEAGLSAGDVIIAVDGLMTDARTLDEQLGAYHPGESVYVHAFRRDELFRTRITLKAGDENTAWLHIIEDGLTDSGRHWLQLG